MKTIVIQLLECMVLSEDEYYKMRDSGHTLDDYAPEGFTLTVRDIRISRGAGFIVVLTGEIMTMPGLPKESQAEKIDVLEDGRIVGLM